MTFSSRFIRLLFLLQVAVCIIQMVQAQGQEQNQSGTGAVAIDFSETLKLVQTTTEQQQQRHDICNIYDRTLQVKKILELCNGCPTYQPYSVCGIFTGGWCRTCHDKIIASMDNLGLLDSTLEFDSTTGDGTNVQQQQPQQEEEDDDIETLLRSECDME